MVFRKWGLGWETWTLESRLKPYPQRFQFNRSRMGSPILPFYKFPGDAAPAASGTTL